MRYKTGDIIKGSINKYPFIYHYGIVLIKDDQVMILHNTPNAKNKLGGNVQFDELPDWLKTRKIANVQRTGISEERIIKYAEKYKARPFNLISFNCEHFIFEIRDGRAHSPQVTETIWNIITVIMVIYTIKNRLALKSS